MLKGIMITLLAGLALVLGAFAAACGGSGGSLTLEEYFEELAALDAQFEEESDALDLGLNEEMADLEEFDAAKDAFVTFFEDAVALLSEFVDDLDGLNPPDEVEAEHEAAVAAGRTTVDAFEGLLEDVRDAETEEDFFALEEDAEFTAASAEFDEACSNLQAIADENSIDIDLDCEN